MKQNNKELQKFLSLMPLCAIATYCLASLNYCIWLPTSYIATYTIICIVGGYVAWNTWRGRSFWRLGLSLLSFSTLTRALIEILLHIPYSTTQNNFPEVPAEAIAVWIFCSIIPTAVCCMIYKYIYSR